MNVVKKINRKDFELYTIKMPLFLKKSKRDAYIAGELEKNHPCFSDKCYWETKYRFSHKGITASIAVIDKVRLARYRRENPGKLLLLEDKSVKRIIKNRKIIILLLLLMISILTIGINSVASAFENIKLSNEKKTENVTEENADDEEKNIKQIFLDVISSKGTIRKLDFIENKLILEISNCFPENLNKNIYEISQIRYENNIPLFNLKYQLQTDIPLEPVTSKSYLTRLRKCFEENNAVLMCENQDSKYGQQFTFVVNKKSAEKITEEINQICISENVSVSTFEMNFIKDKIQLILSISGKNELLNRYYKGYTEFFSLSEMKIEDNHISKKNVENTTELEKIGVFKEGSKTVSFYKDKNGKIKKVEK